MSAGNPADSNSFTHSEGENNRGRRGDAATCSKSLSVPTLVKKKQKQKNTKSTKYSHRIFICLMQYIKRIEMRLTSDFHIM